MNPEQVCLSFQRVSIRLSVFSNDNEQTVSVFLQLYLLAVLNQRLLVVIRVDVAAQL